MNETTAAVLTFAGAAVLSFIITFFAEKKFIPKLKSIKMGQVILDIGPRWHKSKEGTPTMGGLFFIAGTLFAFALFGIPAIVAGKSTELVIIYVFMLLNGAIGFIDDYVKFIKKQNKGLTVMQKLVLQTACAAAFLFAMKTAGIVSTVVTIPFTTVSFDMGAFYWFAALLFIDYVVNSVNLTDGLDGLAGSITLCIMILFSVVAFAFAGEFADSNVPKLILTGSLIGGLIGFLCYNIYPAKVFMGDTGSLFLGAAVTGIAFWLRNPLIIIFCGIIFIIESLSVIIQVISFKLTGKRVFKMTPIHHHFELCGWHETKVVKVFTAVTAAFCILSFFGF